MAQAVQVQVLSRAPIKNSTIFSVDTSGRRKAPTKDFLAGLQGNSEFLARKRAEFFRRGGGASQRFLWHRPFSQKGLNQKQFCPMTPRLLASFGKVRANHSACVKERLFLFGATSWKVTILIFHYDNLAHQSLGLNIQ